MSAPCKPVPASPEAVQAARERLAIIREDYNYLIEAGETHPHRLARRLGFTNDKTLERYLYRNKIPVRHYDPEAQRRAGWGEAV